MKKLFLLLILMAVSVSFACAAEVSTKCGAKDMVFSFGGLNLLGANPYMGGFGMRYFFKDDMAIRPGINVVYNTTKDKLTTGEPKTTTTGFGLNLALEKHLTPAVKSISPYLGAAAGINYNNTKYPGTPEPSIKGTNFNVGVLAGFEWGFAEGFALGGEYNLGLNFGSNKGENGPPGGNFDTSTMGIGINTAALMLSVHW